MTYNPATPNAADRISDTQQPIKTNFEQANTIFDEDHFTFDDASGPQPPPGLRGFHRKSVYQKLDALPDVFAEIGTVFSQVTDGRTDLYYRYDTSTQGNSKVLPLSAIKVMGAFNSAAAVGDGALIAGNMFQLYNVDTITKTGSTYVIAFNDPLDTQAADSDLEYIVLLGAGAATVTATLIYNVPTKNDSLTITAAVTGSRRASFAILTL